MTTAQADESRSPEQELILAGYRYALSLTHHEQNAEDLVQHACLKVFRKRRRLRDKAYMLKAIRNLYYDSCRRRNALRFDDLPEESLADHHPSQIRVVDGQLDMAHILATLSSEEREILYLNCVESFTAAEISTITGKPRGTVLSQLSRTKQKIKREDDTKSSSEETA